MARKNRAAVKFSFSLAADAESIITDMEYLDHVSIILSTAGVTDNTGSFYIDVRNKVTNDPNDQSPWVQLPVGPGVLADADDVFNFEIEWEKHSEIRVRFVAAGGTPDGTVTGFLVAKQAGG